MDRTDLTAVAIARRATKDGSVLDIRLANDLSVRECAQDVGVDPATWSRWERGKITPRAAAAERLCGWLVRLVEASS